MTKLPPNIVNKHRICIVCEGKEEFKYFEKLTRIAVWDTTYVFELRNAKSASSIPALYTNIYQNNSYEAVIIFCDTDKAPYNAYNLIKKKICDFHGGRSSVAGKVIIYANPCSMQIILSHFGDVHLTTQSKKKNAPIIERLTGVANYDAHADQIAAICAKILRRNYSDMKQRVSAIDKPDSTLTSTNIIKFLKAFESDDPNWISNLNKFLTKSE